MFLPTCCPQNMRCCPVLRAYWKPNGNLASLSHLVVCDTILSTGISPIFKNGAPVREWCVFRGGFRKVSGKLRGTKWKSWWGIAEGLCRFVPVVMRPCGTWKYRSPWKLGTNHKVPRPEENHVCTYPISCCYTPLEEIKKIISRGGHMHKRGGQTDRYLWL